MTEETEQPVNAEQMPELSPKELDALLKLYAKDLLFFGPKILKVLSMEGRIVPFELNGPQEILHRIVTHIEESGRLVRLVALKARRMGFSTYFSARYYHKVSWNFNRYAVQVTHEPEATDTLFKMVKRFYNWTPDWLRPSTLYNNTKLLEFNNKEGKGLGSGFRVATAEKSDFGSGQLIHYAHLSESAKWPAETTESLLTSLLQCIPDDPGTEVVFESTAKGVGGEFYDRFWDARYRIWIKRLDENGNPVIEETVNESADENNAYTSVFLPWFVFEKYRIPVPKEFKLTPEEEALKLQFGLDDEQVYWRRFTLANKCRGRIDVLMQEYPATPEEAFVASGRPVFDNIKLLKLKEVAPPPIARYECLTGLQQFIAKPEGGLRVWEEPRPGQAYIISADVAEGLTQGDFSNADVINHRTGDQVAQWHGKMDPDQFGVLLMALGKRYNLALLAVERNNHGLTVVTLLVNEGYPNIYAEMVPEPPGKPRKRYGWVTNSATRPLIIDNLVSEVRDDCHGIRCKESFEEMMGFKIQDNGKMEADRGRHDDRVLSLAIGKHLRQVIPLPSMGLPAHIKRRGKRGTRRKPPTKGWT